MGPETCINCTDGWTGDSCAEGDYFLILSFIKLYIIPTAICSPPNCYNGNCTDISLKSLSAK